MEHFKNNSIELTDIWAYTAQYPDLTVTNNGSVYVVWQKYLDHKEEIYFAQVKDNEIIGETKISGDGLALRPSMHTFNDEVFVVWSETVNKQWKLCVKSFKEGKFSETIVVDEAEALFYPSMKDDGVNPVVVYSKQTSKHSDTILATLGSELKKEVVNQSAKTYRPTVDVDGKGNLYVAYDRYNGHNYDVMVRVKHQNIWLDEVQLSTNENYCTHPVMVGTKEKVTVVWYENGKRCYFNNQAIDVCVKEGELVCSEITNLFENRNWYNNIDLTVNKAGKMVCTYTLGKYNAIAKIREVDGTWSEAIVLTYNDGHCAVRPKVALDDQDNLHYVWQFGNRNGHEHRYACIVYNQVQLEEAKKFYDLEIEKKIDMFIQPIEVEKSLDKPSDEEVKEWLEKNNYSQQVYFGDIHGQSNLSDALGEIDQYYHYAIKDANLDFCALTDHDNYPDIATDAEWEWNRTTRNLFNGEDNFAAILAYEWTSNEYRYDFGHKNVYYPSSEGGLYRSTDLEGYTPYKLFESIKKDKGQCIPHHPAADWGLVSAATDWAFVDDEAQRLVEIFSRHANYEKFEDDSKFTRNVKKKERCCVQDAMARGIRLGFIAGSDSHQMEHGVEGGIMAAFTSELSSEAIFNAMYNRNVYGTTGARIYASIKINGNCMGQEIKIENNDSINVELSVLGVSKLKKVEVIKNNECVFVIHPDNNQTDAVFTDENRGMSDMYYVRVEQEDEQLAWTSPIWVDQK